MKFEYGNIGNINAFDSCSMTFSEILTMNRQLHGIKRWEYQLYKSKWMKILER